MIQQVEIEIVVELIIMTQTVVKKNSRLLTILWRMCRHQLHNEQRTPLYIASAAASYSPF